MYSRYGEEIECSVGESKKHMDIRISKVWGA